jgi:hypothetical protein
VLYTTATRQRWKKSTKALEGTDADIEAGDKEVGGIDTVLPYQTDVTGEEIKVGAKIW